MVAGIEKRVIGNETEIDFAGQSLGVVSVAPISAPSLTEASFGSERKFRVSTPVEDRVSSAFLSIFDTEKVNKMWLLPQGAHVTLSENAKGENVLRIIDTRTEGKGVATELRFDQKATIELAPDRQTIMVVTGDLVTEYMIGQGGTVKTRPVHQAEVGKVITGARYQGDTVVVSSRQASLATAA